MVFRLFYRHLLIKILTIFYRNLCCGFRSIKRLSLVIWWRCVPPKFRPENHKIKVNNNGNRFQPDWSFIDFNQSSFVCQMNQMIHQFGIESVLNSEDRYGRTISHFIASFGTTEALQYIVDCDSNIVNVWRSDQSIPMIHLSLLSGNLTITDFLVTKYDFDISIKDSYDLNAMMRGILCDQCGFSTPRPQDLVLRSHIYGINVNESNNVGLTALHYAVQTCSLQTVSLIVWLGGDISAKDYYGRTAYDFAILYGNKGMLPMLTPTGCCKIGRFNVWMNLLLYIRKLRYITGSRFQELRYWVGITIIIFQLFATFGYLIPTYFFNYYDIKSSIWFIHLLLIGATCVALITGLLTVLRDPGFIKTNGKSYLKLMKYLCNQKLEPYNRCLTLSELTEERHYRLCYICKCLAPKNSKHCYYCGRCCIEYDHHCVFLLTCIGHANANNFIIFNFSMMFCGILGLIIIIHKAKHHFELEKTNLHYEERYIEFNWQTIPDYMDFDNLLDGVFCLKFIIIGFTLGIVTAIKRLYIFRKDVPSTNTKVTYY